MTKQITLRVNKTGVTPYDGKQGQLLNFAPNFLISGPSAMVEVTVTDAPGDACEVSVWPKGPPTNRTGHGIIVSWHPTATMFSTCSIH